MSLLIGTMHYFDNNEREKADKLETKAEMLEKQLSLKVARDSSPGEHFSPIEMFWARMA